MAISALWQDKTVFNVGDTVKISYKIIEENKKERLQAFEGVVIRIRGSGESKTFTVRKIAADRIGVERIFPLNSPYISDLSVTKHPKRKIRRSKLYYLRNQSGKKGKRAN
ncbi:MAG: 50S ribosomal protein L19 [Patescibacteria group bacterium]|nr:50S ribosomal protein L19 [Patescibacteria group bacterium]